MSYHIKRKESLIEGVRRVAHSQLDKMIGEVEDKRLDRHETIHQVRKRCKKLRGLLRLVRPGFERTYQGENKTFRDAARQLSGIRDVAALIETYDMLLGRFDDQVERREFGPIRAALTRELHQLSEHEEEVDNKLARFAEKMQEAKKRVEGWALEGDGFVIYERN